MSDALPTLFFPNAHEFLPFSLGSWPAAFADGSPCNPFSAKSNYASGKIGGKKSRASRQEVRHLDGASSPPPDPSFDRLVSARNRALVALQAVIHYAS